MTSSLESGRRRGLPMVAFLIVKDMTAKESLPTFPAVVTPISLGLERHDRGFDMCRRSTMPLRSDAR